MTRIYPGSFIVALVLAPLTISLPALALAWLLEASGGIPTGLNIVMVIAFASAIFGAPTYLTFGTGFFIMILKRSAAVTPLNFAVAGFVANMVSIPVVAAFSAATGGNSLATIYFYNGFGAIFAPLWGAIFAALYFRFSRNTRQTPA